MILTEMIMPTIFMYPIHSAYYHGVLQDGGLQSHVSNYGKKAIAEDLAESVSYYFHSDSSK